MSVDYRLRKGDKVVGEREIKANKKEAVGLEVLTAMTMKSAIFWDETPCSQIFTNVSEEYTASIFRVEK
jgi:hypothetical protein